jgi:glycosyltransferase involved in cell wall biosynthesis
MRLVFVTQTVDADHPVLAQTVDVVRALAARCESVTVVCASVHRHDLPGNVLFRTFGARTRPARGARFLLAAAASLLPRRSRPDAVVVHMVPLFALLVAPLTKLLRVPILLWYTHWHAGRSLRLATPLVDVVLSVSSGSFPLATSKLRATGHAIDVTRFTPSAPHQQEGPLRLLALGRTARWKGFDTMLAAIELATERGVETQLEVRGPQLTEDEKAHRRELEAVIAASEALRDRVRIEPALPRDEIPEKLRASDALVSATQPRSSETLDKVVYEAAACGVPVIASNTALDEFLAGLPVELRFRARDAESLAQTLLDFSLAGPEARRDTGAELRRRVVAGHSVESWAKVVTEIVAAQGRK